MSCCAACKKKAATMKERKHARKHGYRNRYLKKKTLSRLGDHVRAERRKAKKRKGSRR